MGKFVSRCKLCREHFVIDRSRMKKPRDDPRIVHLQEVHKIPTIRLDDCFETLREDKAMKAKEAPIEIRSKYPRKFVFRDVDRETILSEGEATKALLPIHHIGDAGREYWKGVERLEHKRGLREFRFMYWTRKIGQKNWNWGQFNLCLTDEQLNQLINSMKKEGWLH